VQNFVSPTYHADSKLKPRSTFVEIEEIASATSSTLPAPAGIEAPGCVEAVRTPKAGESADYPEQCFLLFASPTRPSHMGVGPRLADDATLIDDAGSCGD